MYPTNAVYTIAGLPSYSSTEQNFIDLNILKANSINKLQICEFMYCYEHHQLIVMAILQLILNAYMYLTTSIYRRASHKNTR